MEDFVTCIGMERSGSTVSWQISSLLLGQRLEKTHEYVPGLESCIYTYRNPIEAYFSLFLKLSDVYPKSVAARHASRRIMIQKSNYENLVRDSNIGRNVLFIEYEKYYYNPEKRIQIIADFLNIKISIDKLKEIKDQTCIERNIEISNSKNFGIIDNLSHLHGGHINEKSLGEPGFYIKNRNMFDTVAINQKIIEFARFLGYYH